ncbi:helix-turn-helix domain-containing protein [Micromonospora craniellae]|uniref:XRE family transcriptional regulator n=1 Tax=Micromonospora craniellae TaxID=2294034 RepID=A0A372FV39_9ACTN|nr:helix-turn-helix domain-containing protein [Micromonospora craniellae]QOC92437.1 helix-turn-helix transcriptional regulator [Micromonospora craniellae]RFS44568.1 XRE family transcriptional regulator [Micromonospora craniellae]
MTGRGEVPIGRRVAQWRARRRLTQQALADRLGKSKSWVDKVERGARQLDKFSVIQAIAEVLRVDPGVLVGQASSTPTGGGALDGLDEVRAALARYGNGPVPVRPVVLADLRRHVGHAWLTYQHARYPQVVRALPGLLDATRGLPDPVPVEVLVQVYRVASSVLVKLGEADLAWLAADRAVTVAGGDRVLAGTAAIATAAALRTGGRERLALAVTLAAADRLAPERSEADLSVGGTLLVQAALAASACDEARQAAHLLDRAGECADRLGAADDARRTCFGPLPVEMARVVVAAEQGDPVEAVARHDAVIRRDGWRSLSPEYRGAYLVDVARAYLSAGDLAGAGRMLVGADSVAPAEVRVRPSTRTLLAEIARRRPAPAGVARLATLVGLTR